MPDIFVSEGKTEYREDHLPKSKTKKFGEKGFKKSNQFILSTFEYYPQNIKFIDQKPEEKVVLFLRGHLVTNLGWILIGIAMLIAPLVLNNFPILEFLPESFQKVAILAWYLITFAFMFENFLAWYFNVGLVTQERVVDVDFKNLVYREISDANVDKVQDVTVKMGGIFRSLFNFGSIYIQTAGEINNIEFVDVPNPDKVSAILKDLRTKKEHYHKEDNKL